jgi:hypothetical protein
MFGNGKYASQVNHFCLIRNKEELTPNRYVEDNLQLADIERTLNNFDLQYQLHRGGTPNNNASTNKRTGPNRFNKPNHSAHQVHVAPKSTGGNSIMCCFICNSTDRKVGQCPGKSKEEIVAAYEKYCEHMKSSRSNTATTTSKNNKKKQQYKSKTNNSSAAQPIQQSSAAVDTTADASTVRFSSAITSDDANHCYFID